MIYSIAILSLLLGAGYAAPVLENAPETQLLKRGQSTASVPATLTEGIEWLVPISIANKTYNVQLDTGSADLWLFCAGGKAQGHNQYDPKTGTKVDGATFSVTYGSGYAKGDVYTDRVSVGALTAHQAVGCATDTDATDSNDKQLDGIMGMGFNSGSKSVNNGYPQNPHATQSAANAVTTKGGGFLGLFQSNQPYAQMSFAESVFPQLQSGLFTADLNFKAKGSYNFGYIDQQRFSTAITYMPVRHWNNWIVETSAYSVGSNAAKTKTWKALVDTGTTNVLLPQDAVTEYFSQVPSSQPPASQGGTYLVPCDSTKAALPPLTFTFTPPAPKAQLVQPGGSGGLNTKPYNAVIPGNYFIGNPTGKSDGMCQAGLGAVGTGQAWDVILGDVFLMSQLVVFDLGDANGQNDENFPQHGQIGFAPKPSGNGTSSATGSAPSATSS